MKFNNLETSYKILKAEGEKKHKNLLAYASITFKSDSGDYFTFSGFTIWKSIYGGYNVEVPAKINYKYFLCEKGLWGKIKKEIIKQYEWDDIPIVEDMPTREDSSLL